MIGGSSQRAGRRTPRRGNSDAVRFELGGEPDRVALTDPVRLSGGGGRTARIVTLRSTLARATPDGFVFPAKLYVRPGGTRRASGPRTPRRVRCGDACPLVRVPSVRAAPTEDCRDRPREQLQIP